MYLKIKSLGSFSMLMKDGELGSIDNLYFDPGSLNIRYIVGDTRPWFFGGKVFLSPEACTTISLGNKTMTINATKEQVKNSPKPEEGSPIFRSFEERLSDYYGWPYYWRNTISPSVNDENRSGNPFAGALTPTFPKDKQANTEFNQDQLLLNVKEMKGFQVWAKNHQIGRVSDILINHHTWKIELLELEIGDLLLKQYIPISTEWITDLDWPEQKITVNNDHYHSAENELRAHVHAGQPFSE